MRGRRTLTLGSLPMNIDETTTTKTRARILIVDDDGAALQSLQRGLSEHYFVLVTTRAQDALTLMLSGWSFDVVLCCVVVSDMSGMAFHAAVARLVPEMAGRVVFMMGAKNCEKTAAYLETVPNMRLQKPISVGFIRELVDGRRLAARGRA